MSLYDLVKSGQLNGVDTTLAAQVAALSILVNNNILNKQATALGTGSQTLVTANVQDGILTSTPAAAATFTLPTAALLVAGSYGGLVGQGFEFTIVNLSGSNAITVAAGTGVTLVGAVVVATSSSGTFYAMYTNVSAGTEAVTIYRK